MNLRVLLSAFLAWPLCAMPGPDFVGVLTCGSETQVRLVDRGTGAAAWVGEGQTFQGFTLKTYDAVADEITLVRRERELRLRLPLAKVKPASALSPAAAAAIRANLQTLVSAARAYFRSHEAHYVTASELIDPRNETSALVSVAGEDYRRVSFMKGETAGIAVTTAAGERVSLTGSGE